MVGPAFDCLMNPLGVVRRTFHNVANTTEDFNPISIDGKDWGVREIFNKFLFEDDGISRVPVLNAANLPWIQPNSLVRFRGMVQDMLDKEYYVGAFKDGSAWKTNKFADISSGHCFPTSEMQLWERRVLYCIPIPGLNDWMLDLSPSKDLIGSHAIFFSSQHKEKRQRDTMDVDPEFIVSADACGSTSCAKKQRENGSPHISEPECSCDAISTSPLSSASDARLLPCLVKMYDFPHPDPKLNDLFEFVGVFTFDPELAVCESDCNGMDLSDDALAHLPPSKVPRIHCLVHRKLAVQDLVPSVEIASNTVKVIRESLLKYLKTVVCNDDLAARYLLLHLLSKVYARVGMVAVGSLSLNLSGLREEYASFGGQLNHAIQSLLPFSQYISLNLDYLNTAAFSPRKDYQSNRLITGVLQLAEGTHMTIDETHLNSGTLDSFGISNVLSLKDLITSQKVEYKFDYYTLEMESDVQLLILSDGKSTILPADLVLPFRPTANVQPANPTPEELKAWRWYLAECRQCTHIIEPAVQKIIEDDMVAARQRDRTVGASEFSRWLTMARLMTASYGETTLLVEQWQMVMEMERLRKERLL